MKKIDWFSIRNFVKRRTDGVFKGRAKVVVTCFLVLLLVGNTFGVARIQLFHGEEYRQKAAWQQLYDTKLEPIRGTIYDRNMSPLATSTSAWDLVFSPFSLNAFFKDMPECKEPYLKKLTKDVSKIIGVKKDELYEAFTKTYELESGDKAYYKYSIVKKKITAEERVALEQYLAKKYTFKYMAEVEKWFGLKKEMAELDGALYPSGLFTYENSSNRIYADGSFASSVIGVVNADGKGQTGIEGYYNETLSGETGRVVTAKNNRGQTLESSYQTVFDAGEGNSLVLTLDGEIQSFLENALAQAYEDIDCDTTFGIVMDVDTGAILAMAERPDFDLNNAYTLAPNMNVETLKDLEKGSIEYKTEYSRLLQTLWNNFSVTDNYEPGSTFKIFTASALIEEGVANLNTTYTCTSRVKVITQGYGCANGVAHGTQSITKALMNSCNCFFITMGQKLGREAYNKYFEAFGFSEKTGVDLTSEATPSVHDPETMSLVDLASTSFGQSVRISPIQLITATCAIANGGNLMKPYIVSRIVDEDGNIVAENEPTVRRKVISETTASTVASMMEAVVEGGTGKNAYISGYRVAGKTATAEKLDNVNEEIYSASFVCFAPADDPEVAILVGVDNPRGAYRGGGVLAAPIAKQVLEPTLEYLNVERRYTSSELSAVSKTTPALIGESVSSAKMKAANEGLTVKVVGEGDSVVSQVPSSGQNIPDNGVIVIYTESEMEFEKSTVPDFTSLTISEANVLASKHNLNIIISAPTDTVGARCYGQSVSEGNIVEAGSSITVYFRADNIVED